MASHPVTRANWRTHPHSVWAFQHIDQMLPTRIVGRGRGPVRPLPEGSEDLGALVFADAEELSTCWPDFLARTHTDAILVLHGGRIAAEHYRNGMTVETPHLVFSITKSIVGLLAELLARDGIVNLTWKASDYVPELAGSTFGAATLRDLLDMRDGVEFDETYADANADIHRYSAAYWGEEPGGVEVMLPALAPAAVSPGAFAYRTPVADVIGWVLRRAARRSLSDLVSDLIWSRIGAEHDAFFILDAAGTEIAGAGFNCTLRDLARLALHLRDICTDGPGIVSTLLAGGDREAFAASGRHPTRPGYSYRSFWWVRHDPAPALCALGVFGQRIFWEPASDLIVIRFGSHPVASNAATDPIHDRAFAAIAAHLNRES